MRHTSLLTWLAASLALTASLAVVAPAGAAEPPRISSSLVSVTQVASWDSQRWGYEFDAWKAAGITEVVLNGTAVASNGEVSAYYPSGVPNTKRAVDAAGAPADPVTRLLDGARRNGLHVWLGTYLPDSSWFSMNDADVDELTAENATLTTDVMRDLDTTYSGYRDVVAGWYLGSEVGAQSAWSWKAGEALKAYYSQLISVAHERTTTTRTMASPYYNIAALPDTGLWTSMWTRILTAAPIDVVALQDGTGDCGDNVCGPWRSPETDRADVVAKYRAAATAVTAAHAATQVWGNLDLYDAFGFSKPIADLAATQSAMSPYVTGYTSWSFTRQYSAWTLGIDTYQAPFTIWNTTGVLPETALTTPVVSPAGGNAVSWTASAASGNRLAFYRVYSTTGQLLGDTTHLNWTGASPCVVIVAVDAVGNTSAPAPSC